MKPKERPLVSALPNKTEKDGQAIRESFLKSTKESIKEEISAILNSTSDNERVDHEARKKIYESWQDNYGK